MEPEDLFAGHPTALLVVDRVRAALATIGPVEVRTTRSQVAFRRTRAFAWVWRPSQYLGPRGAEAVVSFALDRRELSPRLKSVVEPRPGRFMHHLEVGDPDEIDDSVVAWLREAADRAG